MKTKLHYVFSIAIFLFSVLVFGQKQSSMWASASEEKIKVEDKLERISQPKLYEVYQLDLIALRNSLVNAPTRNTTSTSNVVVSFPNHEGKFESFEIFEASNMAPELQAQFPEIRAYLGRSLENPSSVIRFSVSPEKGLSTMLLNEGKTVFIEPYTQDLSKYIVYINSKEDRVNTAFECLTDDSGVDFDMDTALNNFNTANRNADDGKLRTFRLALACTGEYTQYHGGTVNGALAAMNTTMTRVNGVYNRDMAIQMNIIANNNLIIYTNGATDPYTNNDGGAMLGENQTNIDAVIGSANYDIGHVFSTGGGGIAQLNSPCTTAKARGVTGSPAPIGDFFDIDYVAHEMGHQYGATHTQNNSCQISTNSSMEPGSASTIMGYAGICSPNVQVHSDDYFHAVSILQMWNNVTAGNSQCATQSNTGNTAPVANAGADYNIPKSTAYVLKGAATDVNVGDALTYCWEQFDPEQATMPPVSTSSVGPAYRSLTPVSSPNRYMPAFSTVLGGSLQSTWEVTPSVARTMQFVLTVRDNVAGGASTNTDLMTVTVEDVTPFTVNQPSTWAPGSNQIVSWVVGQTTNATINCQSVNILFSNNGGSSFDYTLASNVPNDGSQSVTIPNVTLTNNARILVEAADNIFYAVTDNFTLSTAQDFSIASLNSAEAACNSDMATFNFAYTTSNGFSDTVTFSASGQPAGSTINFTPLSLNTDGNFSLEVGNLLSVTNGNYNITVTGTSASITKTANVSLTITDGVCASVANTSFDTSTTGVVFNTISNLNTGKPSGYSDYTGLSTDVNRESSYDLSVFANSDGNYQIITYAWIDWNQNCVFDSNEEYDLGTSVNINNQLTANSPLSITVPADAVLGSTIMRITTKYTDPNANQFPTSCENGHDAEVEDYTVNVLTSLSVDDFEFEGFALFPNPNNGSFTVNLNTVSQNPLTIEVFDIRGRSIYRKSYSNVSGEFREEVNLNAVQSGMYMVNVTDGERRITKKIIVE